MSAMVILAAVSCAKVASSDKGQVTFELSNNQQIADMTKSNVSDYTSLPSASDFTITITGAGYCWTGTLSQWEESNFLAAGEYSVTATYGDLEDEGFDKPYFTGSESFTVIGGETVNTTIPVQLGNTVVKVSCSEYFKEYYKDYRFELSRNGSTIATFAKDQNKAAFVDAYKFTLSGTMTSDTKTYTFSKDYTNLAAATAYTFNFDVANAGSSSITITFKEGYTETIELGDLELND